MTLFSCAYYAIAVPIFNWVYRNDYISHHTIIEPSVLEKSRGCERESCCCGVSDKAKFQKKPQEKDDANQPEIVL